MSTNESSKELSSCDIRTWKQFSRKVRARGCSLLQELDRFTPSVLVSGCQRSGTTALSRLITNSEGMIRFKFGKDDELDAALILSGSIRYKPEGRYCFQTTYLNECYNEYYDHIGSYKMLWVLRNPYSVVYSLLHHWRRFPFNELFIGCGLPMLNDRERRLHDRFGSLAISRLRRACLSYNGKLSQMIELYERLGREHMMVVDYDNLVRNKNDILPDIFQFIGIDYKNSYADSLHASSLDKASKLSLREHAAITDVCMQIYDQAIKYCHT